jgi:hypothetical protein
MRHLKKNCWMLFLSIAGFNADPDAVTKILGIEPTWVARKGDALNGGRFRKTNQWRFAVRSTPLASGGDHKDALETLTRLLAKREAAFAELHAHLKPQSVEIWGNLDVDSNQSKIWLDPISMKLLAACGVVWGLDLTPEA